MKKKYFATTFSKMTLSFVLFGLIPLLLLSLLFFFRYSSALRQNMLHSYFSMTSYISKNVGDVLNSVDETLGSVYDYRDDTGRSLADLLKDDGISQSEREQEVDAVLREMMGTNEYVSSFRLIDYRGQIYSLYYNQDKTLSKEGYEYMMREVHTNEEDLTKLKLFGTIPEDKICINSEDYVFGMLRNYMDTSTIESARNESLGLLYADVNVEVIGDIVKKSGIPVNHFYIFSASPSRYIYSVQSEDYLDGNDPLEFCENLLDGSRGCERIGNRWVFYEPVEGMDAYAVMVVDNSELMGSLFQIRTMMILILCFAGAFLLLLYMTFSTRMSEPTRQLKEAMEQVEEGNLNVRVDLNTRDEMEYVADGFNKMTEKLTDYINQVYVAQISQKDAELNALKMQIQPHYLYNTLDVIRMAALEQNDRRTAELLESLARQLRYVMGSQSDRVYLKEELDAIREYFVLMRARYEGKISLMINIADEDRELVIPKLLLQPMVENAIRHGLREKEGNGAVGIHVERKKDYLEIVVMDDGVGMSEEQVKHMQQILDNPEIGVVDEEGRVSVGMKNVYDRIKLNCGPEYGFVIQSAQGLGTSVTFHLPIWKEL